MISKVCIWILFVIGVSGLTSELEDTNVGQKHSKLTQVVVAGSGCYNLYMLANSLMESSTISDELTRRPLLSMLFASIALEEAIGWTYGIGYEALKNIAHLRFGDKVKLVQDKEMPLSWKRIKVKEEWVDIMNARASTMTAVSDIVLAAYILYSHAGLMCTDPFFSLMVRLPIMLCTGVVIVENIKCLIFSQKIDTEVPWRQFSLGFKKILFKALFFSETRGLNLGLYTPSQSRFRLKCVDFLENAVVGSALKDTFFGGAKIFNNFRKGWDLWRIESQVHQKNDETLLPFLEPKNVSSKSIAQLQVYGGGNYAGKPQKMKKPRKKNTSDDTCLNMGVKSLSETKNERQREAQEPVVISEDLRNTLEKLRKVAHSSNSMKITEFTSYLSAAIAYREKLGVEVSCEQENNKNKIIIMKDGKKITFTYEPSHRQNGQNSTEYNGFKLIKALKVVQNL
jgi:hypothetical protein